MAPASQVTAAHVPMMTVARTQGIRRSASSRPDQLPCRATQSPHKRATCRKWLRNSGDGRTKVRPESKAEAQFPTPTHGKADARRREQNTAPENQSQTNHGRSPFVAALSTVGTSRIGVTFFGFRALFRRRHRERLPKMLQRKNRVLEHDPRTGKAHHFGNLFSVRRACSSEPCTWRTRACLL